MNDVARHRRQKLPVVVGLNKKSSFKKMTERTGKITLQLTYRSNFSALFVLGKTVLENKRGIGGQIMFQKVFFRKILPYGYVLFGRHSGRKVFPIGVFRIY